MKHNGSLTLETAISTYLADAPWQTSADRGVHSADNEALCDQAGCETNRSAQARPQVRDHAANTSDSDGSGVAGDSMPASKAGSASSNVSMASSRCRNRGQAGFETLGRLGSYRQQPDHATGKGTQSLMMRLVRFNKSWDKHVPWFKSQ